MRIIVFAWALLLAACSTGTRLAYNNLDSLLRLEVSDYVELEAPQRALLEREFAAVWDWHRASQLPRYAAALRGVADTVERGNPDRAAIDRIGNEIDQLTDALQRQATPAIAQLLATLDEAQVATLLEEQADELDKALAKTEQLSPAKRRERRAKRSEDRLRDWLGSITPAQRAVVARYVAAAEARGALSPEDQRARNQRYRQDLAVLLASRRQPGLAQRVMALGEPTEGKPAAERSAARERGRSYFAELAATLEPQQREYLAKRLRKLAADCEALAAAKAQRSDSTKEPAP